MKIVELFSGIGSQAKALKNLGIDVKVQATCEWDIHAFVAYDAIHNSPFIDNKYKELNKKEILNFLEKYTLSNNGKEPMLDKIRRIYSLESLRRIMCSIERNNNLVDVSKVSGKELNSDIDILTYSFPCQDLSNVGAFHGYNKGIDKDSGSRSSLLWQVGRILTEMKDENKILPRFLVMENVPSLLAERHKENFNTWIQDLKDLGYESCYYQLNASDFGLPQNRPRLIMVSVWVGSDESRAKKVRRFLKEYDNGQIAKAYSNSKYYREYSLKGFLRTDYSNEKLLKEALECNPNDTVSRRQIWDENPQIVREGYKFNNDFGFVRTLTTKQDRNPNSGNLYFDRGREGKSKFRYLTPRECFLFMGFTDADYDNVIRNNPEIRKGAVLFPRDKLIRMAGNSIPVKMLEGVFLMIKTLDDLIMKDSDRKCEVII